MSRDSGREFLRLLNEERTRRGNRLKRRLAGLADFVGQDIVVRIDRKPLDKFSLDGLVIGMSGRLLCLHVVDDKTLMMNGYAVVRLSDIRSFQVDETAFIDRALRLLRRTPIVPEAIDLSSWGPLLTWVQSQYPLVTICTEQDAPGCAFIGKLVSHSARSVVVEAVSVSGHWDGQQEFAFKEITMVEFGDGYVNALTALIAHETSSA